MKRTLIYFRDEPAEKKDFARTTSKFLSTIWGGEKTMRYQILQSVKIVDMNNEIMSEVLFDHGEYEAPALAIGYSVVHYELGLKQFEVVYDKRPGRTVRRRVVDIELDLISKPATTKAFLEPVTLIIGQHDVGEL